MEGFKKYTRDRLPEKYITVSNRCINLSPGVGKIYCKGYEACELYYNKKEGKVLIKLIHKMTKDSLSLCHTSWNEQRHISAKAFYKQVGIKILITKRYFDIDFKDNCLIIKLDQGD